MANSAVLAQSMSNEVGDALMWMVADYPGVLNLPLFDAPENPGFGGRQSFSKSDLFYSSMASVTSAAVGKCARRENGKADLSKIDFAMIAFPVIVIDGLLFEARYDKASDRVISLQTEHVRCHWRGAPSWPLHATVDIISRNGVAAFVEQRRKDFDVLQSNLSEARALLEKAIVAGDPKILNLGDQPRGRGGGPTLLRALFRPSKGRPKSGEPSEPR
jgi:hypothetical protein